MSTQSQIWVFLYCMLVLLNDNLNSFSPPPAPSFGQMLHHLSKGVRCGTGKQTFLISFRKTNFQTWTAKIILQQKSLIRFPKLLFVLTHSNLVFRRTVLRLLSVWLFWNSFRKSRKHYYSEKWNLSKYASQVILDRQNFNWIGFELKLSVFVIYS